MNSVGRLLREKWWATVLEIAAVFTIAFLIIFAGWSIVGEDAFARQIVVWIANVAMLATIGAGLLLRRQTAAHLGLRAGVPGLRAVIRVLLQSMVILIAALAAFLAGSALSGAASGAAEAPQAADMSGYAWLQGNLPMLLLALGAVWIVSSLGEEVIYRGFLMTRIAGIGAGTRAAWALAVAGSSIVFGLAHFGWGAVGIVQTTLMGAVLAMAWLIVRRNLWVLVLSHVWLDTLLLVQLYAGEAGS